MLLYACAGNAAKIDQHGVNQQGDLSRKYTHLHIKFLLVYIQGVPDVDMVDQENVTPFTIIANILSINQKKSRPE